ncbi:hypothetical protein NW768_002718 [Fusarium equiseti]|uniref:Uncharacterized protein n=1 Tax=Fusarium equiseti TaxID=61235 RepID=A0ABQ8RK18_FUSEQ|nr:hypothetical protein NW768_002718 [Fusarium equiseti]
MHSAWTLVTFLLAAAPSALAGKCQAPRGAGENNNCLGGDYPSCVNKNNALCWAECSGNPAGGAGAQCHTGCTTRNQQYCAGYCMAINNCDDCIEHLKQMGAAGNEDNWREACSQEGESQQKNVCEEA